LSRVNVKKFITAKEQISSYDRITESGTAVSPTDVLPIFPVQRKQTWKVRKCGYPTDFAILQDLPHIGPPTFIDIDIAIDEGDPFRCSSLSSPISDCTQEACINIYSISVFFCDR